MVIICTVILGKNKDIRVTETRKIGWELGKIIDIKTISPKVKLFTGLKKLIGVIEEQLSLSNVNYRFTI